MPKPPSVCLDAVGKALDASSSYVNRVAIDCASLVGRQIDNRTRKDALWVLLSLAAVPEKTIQRSGTPRIRSRVRPVQAPNRPFPPGSQRRRPPRRSSRPKSRSWHACLDRAPSARPRAARPLERAPHKSGSATAGERRRRQVPRAGAGPRRPRVRHLARGAARSLGRAQPIRRCSAPRKRRRDFHGWRWTERSRPRSCRSKSARTSPSKRSTPSPKACDGAEQSRPR